MTTDRRLVAKGTNEPFQALVDQGRYHLKLAEQHAAELAEHNWTQQQTAEGVMLGRSTTDAPTFLGTTWGGPAWRARSHPIAQS